MARPDAREPAVKRLGLVISIGMVFSLPAHAAGIDSRVYTCANLQALIAGRGFVFIGQPAFGDFVVANASFCGGGGVMQQRRLAPADYPACPVNYCTGYPSDKDN